MAKAAFARTIALVSGVLTLPLVGLHGIAQSSGRRRHISRDISRILQRSCQECHHADGVAPMSLVTYEEVRPWARSMKARTALRSQRGAMPPFFVEKNIGIQKFKHDPSLSDEEIAAIARWADSGAPRGNATDLPKPLNFDDSDKWTIGEPDMVLKSKEVLVPASGPDWWGDIGLVPTGLTEDRYASAVEVREINDIPRAGGTKTVGGRYVFHHMTYTSVMMGRRGPATSWRAAGRFTKSAETPTSSRRSGPLLQANSALSLDAGHIHSNGRETRAHLEFAFKLFPEGYKPIYKRSTLRLGNGIDIDVKPNQANQELHAYATLQEHTKIIAFEPHLHAPGVRMCLEAIWGHNIQTLNCVGYDHNWVKQYVYEDDAAPLLPKGTIVHLIGFLDTTAANKNPAIPRNWAGGGRDRSPTCSSISATPCRSPRISFRPRWQAPREDEEPQRLRHRLPAWLGATDSDDRAARQH
jgi:hypothetical protein